MMPCSATLHPLRLTTISQAPGSSHVLGKFFVRDTSDFRLKCWLKMFVGSMSVGGHEHGVLNALSG